MSRPGKSHIIPLENDPDYRSAVAFYVSDWKDWGTCFVTWVGVRENTNGPYDGKREAVGALKAEVRARLKAKATGHE